MYIINSKLKFMNIYNLSKVTERTLETPITHFNLLLKIDILLIH